MVEVRQLRHLLAVADHGSFRGAARAVHLSQPALTKSIQQLERHFGAPLFDRSGQRVVPTQVGRAVIERSRAIAAECEALGRMVEGMVGLSFGSLVVGAGPYVADAVLGPALGRILGRYPGLRVRVKVDNARGLTEALEHGGIDLFVADLAEIRHRPGLEIRELPPEPITWFCRPGHPLTRRGRVSQSELLGFPVAAPRLPPWAEQWFRDAGAPPLAVQGDHYPMIKQVVLLSECVSGAPGPVVADDLGRGVLARLDVDAPPMQSDAGVVRLRNRTLPPAAVALIAELLAPAPDAAAPPGPQE